MKTYIRKTKDEYHLLVNYGYGWEHEITENNPKEIADRRKEYLENCPQYATKIKKVRIKQ